MNKRTKKIKNMFLACLLLKHETKKGKIAITQIMILLIGIIAFTNIISAETIPNPASPPRYVWWKGTRYVRQANGDYLSESTTISAQDMASNIAGEDGGATLAGGSSSTSEWLSDKWGFQQGSNADAFLSGLQWAVTTYFAVQMLGEWFGLTEGETDALSAALAAGMGVYKYAAVKGSSHAWAWGLGTAFLVLSLFPTGGDKYIFTCKRWQAPTGGAYCDKCNKQGILPCSEYQCKSLGQSCELVNKGTKEEMCVYVNQNDFIFPEIRPWEDALSEDYFYTPDNTISPPDTGVRINNSVTSDGCIPAYTPLEFGVILNEPAICKISSQRLPIFEDMPLTLSEGLSVYNHTIRLSLPGVDNAAQEGIELENDGEFNLFVRCQDANGNSNDANFVFRFCVQKEQDTTVPAIDSTSILNNKPVAFGQDEIDLNVYVNEPADCKWSKEDKSYDNMENQMDCSNAQSINDAMERNGRVVYRCRTLLTGIKDKQENKFYFKCRDQPLLKGTDRESDRNTNTQSYPFTLIGTQPLLIDEAGPSGTVKDSTTNVEVILTAKTSAGFNNGEAACYSKEKEEGPEEYDKFFDTNSHTHSTKLSLPEGDYEYVIKCEDAGGNYDEWQINFSVESDTEAPEIARIYHSENLLTVTTDENASCVYDTISCNYLFENGIPLATQTNQKVHVTDWNTKTKFYIKCRDEFGNEPDPNECSIIAKPIE